MATKKLKNPERKPSIPRKPAGRRAPRRKKHVDLSDEAIRLRAYFIAERRMRLAIPGDPSGDWLEAKRQLLEETAGPKPTQ